MSMSWETPQQARLGAGSRRQSPPARGGFGVTAAGGFHRRGRAPPQQRPGLSAPTPAWALEPPDAFSGRASAAAIHGHTSRHLKAGPGGGRTPSGRAAAAAELRTALPRPPAKHGRHSALPRRQTAKARGGAKGRCSAAIPPAGPRRVGEREERGLPLPSAMSKHVFLTGPPGNGGRRSPGSGARGGGAAAGARPGLVSRPARGCEALRAGGRQLLAGPSTGPGVWWSPGGASSQRPAR